MKRKYTILIFAITVVAMFCNHPARAGLDSIPSSRPLKALATQFETPQMEYRPCVWWHWLGGNFTTQGITKDLEAMAESGIGGACIFNIASSVQESHSPMENLP
ncbi:MAG: hypothetical protein LBD76_08835, partial [Prevotellaceae bacterium]|nr:hypothetical protein [Prevotellaceae bacterium]